jgi:hypothetical protein
MATGDVATVGEIIKRTVTRWSTYDTRVRYGGQVANGEKYLTYIGAYDTCVRYAGAPTGENYLTYRGLYYS